MTENRIGVSPFSWGDAINAFKGAGEMQLVGISHGTADLVDGVARHLQELRSLDHAVADQKLLRGFAYGILEYFAKIASVEAGALGDVLNGDIVHVIVVDISESFLDVEVLDIAGGRLVIPDRSCQCVDKNIEVSDQMEGRLFLVP